MSLKQATSFARSLKHRFFPRPPKVWFIHIPRVGGTSFSLAMVKAYKGNSYYDLVTCSSSASTLLYPEETERNNEYTLRQYLVAYQLASETGFVSAHAPFNERLRAEFSDYKLVSILRNPLDRYLSEFFYNSQKPCGHARLDIALEEFVDSPRGVEQGQILVNYIGNTFKNDTMSLAAKVETAKCNLFKIDVIGFAESMSAFEDAIQQKLGLKVRMPHLNKTTLKAPVAKHLLKKIEALCEPDFALFNFAKERFGSM